LDKSTKTPRGLLIAARKERLWSQQELASLLGTTQHNISRWEQSTTTPSPYFSKKLCELFGKSAQELGLLDEPIGEARLPMQTPSSPKALSVAEQNPPHWHVPYPRNLFFTGREALLRSLDVLLRQQNGAMALTQSHALYGLGGIGKTQIALEYVYRYASAYTAILWVSAETTESLFASFASLADVLNLPERDEPDQHKMVRAIIRWLGNHKDWLLVFDNVEDLALLQTFLPASRYGSVLLTTRLQTLGTIAQRIAVKPMDAEEGLIFLLQRAKLLRPGMPSSHLAPIDVLSAQAIVEMTGGLPLALDQSGAYLEETQCGLKDYLNLFRSSPLELLDARDSYLDHPFSVTRTFILAFEQLERTNVLAAEIVTICAYLSPDAIPEALFLDGAVYLGPTFETLTVDPLRFNAALKALLMYSLIQRNAATHTLTIHRLVQTVLKGHLSEELQHLWVRRVTCAIAHLFPVSETQQAEYWQVSERFLPHALVCLTESERQHESDAEQITLANRVASYLRYRARYAEAEALFRRALQMRKQAHRSEHPQIIETLHGLASLFIHQGKYQQAEPLLQQALDLSEQFLSPEDILKADVLYSVGALSFFQGKYAEAEAFYLQALHIWEHVWGPEHPQPGKAFLSLATLHKTQGNYTEAELLYRRALHIHERDLGGEHPQVGAELNDLASLYLDQGKYEQAEPLLQRALGIWERSLGEEHPSVAYPLSNLAEIAVTRGHYEQAHALYQRALRIGEQGLGPNHPLVALLFRYLADLATKQSMYEQAKSLYQHALAIQEQALGPDHQDTVETRTKYTALLQALDQDNEVVSGEKSQAI
jgi:tetratricopeptide (TPR) repeat protein/transcriptional regulator with XRE-family HTH domain